MGVNLNPHRTDLNMDFGDEHNDETFGGDVSGLGTDFDFGSSETGATASAGRNSESLQQRVLTVEELERQFSQPQHVQPVKQSYASATAPAPMIKQKLSVAELESQMLAASIKQPSVMPPQPLAPGAIPAEHLAILQQIHQEEAEFQQRKAKHDGIMSDSDKNFIAKIQLSQLAGDPMYREDFYYKLWQAKKIPATESQLPPPTDILPKEESTGKESQLERFEKLLSEVKIRPKVSQVDIKGALGSVAVNSLRNPKQIIQIKVSKEDASAAAARPPHSYKHAVGTIESIYLDLIAVDQMYARWKEESAQLLAGSSPEEARQQKHQEWNQEYTELMKRIWRKIHSFDTQQQLKQRSDEEIVQASPSEFGAAMLISVGKGRKMLGRLLKFLPPEMTLRLLKAILLATGRVTVKSSLEPDQVLAEMEEYANNVAFSFVSAISNVPIKFIIDCIDSARQSGFYRLYYSHDVTTYLQAGLLLLTLLISRAVLIKQKAPAETEIDPDYSQWTESVYPAFFTALQGHFNEIFPPSHLMPSVMTAARGGTGGAISKPVPVDQQYVWQFFAALAHCSDPDQQRVIVAELREKIIETIFQQGEAGSKKVNIFLNALGLDASQLM